MRKKKTIPLAILTIFEPYVGMKGVKFDVDPTNDDYILYLKDIDIDSDFFFAIKSYTHNQGNSAISLILHFSPTNEHKTQAIEVNSSLENLKQHFNNWLELLNRYRAVQTFLDDPFLETFENEFEAHVNIEDKDADQAPFTTDKILLLDDALSALEIKVLEYSKVNPIEDIDQITEAIQEVRDNLVKKSKRWVIKKLSTVFGKLAKQGPGIIKTILHEAMKEAIKVAVKGGLEQIVG